MAIDSYPRRPFNVFLKILILPARAARLEKILFPRTTVGLLNHVLQACVLISSREIKLQALQVNQ